VAGSSVEETVQNAGLAGAVVQASGSRLSQEGPIAEPRPLFGDVYRDSFPEMVRLAFLLTGSREVAEDVVQDSFLRMYRRWDGVERPRAYLRRSVVNACRSHHRRRRREREHRPDAPDAVGLGADELADALAGLPYRQQAALVLRFYHDLGEAEIAAALSCRPGTVGSLIHRGLAELRKVIRP
jgi:RNA polymerase sigma-70 factor (sigma-E family)